MNKFIRKTIQSCRQKKGHCGDMNGREPAFLKEFRMRMRSASGNRNG